MVQIFGGAGRELTSREEQIDFIMAGAEDDNYVDDFDITDENVNNAIATVRNATPTIVQAPPHFPPPHYDPLPHPLTHHSSPVSCPE